MRTDRNYRPSPSEAKAVLVLICALIAITFLALVVAHAGEDTTVWIHPRIPSEEEKAAAIRKAYELNGNSMVGWYMIDLSKPEPPPVTVRTIPIEPKKRERK